jgi:hypothetical protein
MAAGATAAVVGGGVETAKGGVIGGGGAAGIGGGPAAKAAGSPDIILENIIGSIPGGIGIPAAPAAATISAAVGSTVPVIKLYPGGPEEVGGAIELMDGGMDIAGIWPNPMVGSGPVMGDP